MPGFLPRDRLSAGLQGSRWAVHLAEYQSAQVGCWQLPQCLTRQSDLSQASLWHAVGTAACVAAQYQSPRLITAALCRVVVWDHFEHALLSTSVISSLLCVLPLILPSQAQISFIMGAEAAGSRAKAGLQASGNKTPLIILCSGSEEEEEAAEDTRAPTASPQRPSHAQTLVAGPRDDHEAGSALPQASKSLFNAI